MIVSKTTIGRALVTEETCVNCLKPKGSVAGSLTQWISVCTCDQYTGLPASYQSVDTVRCKVCEKPIREKHSGSLTQWIFKQDSCNCDRPVVQEASKPDFIQHAFHGFDDTDENELEFDGDKFPIERYKPISVLGEGISGSVILSRDRVLEKRVAVKVLRILEPEKLVSFQNEARTTSRLSHPNIVKVLDFGSTDGGVPYMVMELLDGSSLDKLLAHHGHLDLNEAISLFIQLSAALDYAHNSDVLHRDLKPGNILIVEEDDTFAAHLIDFGVAKLKPLKESTIYNGTEMVGTPAYMSPDQALGKSFDKRSDIYSLGCVMFETVTGRKVFEADTPLEVIALHAHKKPPSVLDFLPETPVSKAMSEIVERCLSKEPNQRFPDAMQLRNALKAIPVVSQSDGNVSNEDEPLERENFHSGSFFPSFVTMALLIGAILVVGATMMLFSLKREVGLNNSRQEVKRDSDLNSDAPQPVRKAGTIPNWVLVSFETDKSLAQLVRAKPDLTQITIDNSRISPAGLSVLKKLRLDTLNFTENQPLTKEHFRSIAELPFLIRLKLKPVGEIDLTGLDELRNSKLDALDIFNQAVITNKNLEDISKIKTLKELRLENCQGFASADIGQFAALPLLIYIDLGYSDINESNLAQLKSLTQLQHLCLNRTLINDKVFDVIAKMPSLKTVEMFGCPNVSEKAFSKFKLKSKMNIQHDTTSDFQRNIPKLE